MRLGTYMQKSEVYTLGFADTENPDAFISAKSTYS